MEVKLEKKRIGLFVKRLQLIGIVAEVGSAAISRNNTFPMLVVPVVMVGNFHFFIKLLVVSSANDGYAQNLNAVSPADNAAVAER